CLACRQKVVVLIDHNTKSAAELFAGILKDQQRAVLIGEQSFGKALIQDVWDFNGDNSIKVVTGQYYLPRSGLIQYRGLSPDIMLPMPKSFTTDELIMNISRLTAAYINPTISPALSLR